MTAGQTTLERRLKGRADTLIIMMMDGDLTAEQVIGYADRLKIDKETILRASDYLAKKREIDHRPFPAEMYEGINRSSNAMPNKDELWCPKKGHYVDIYTDGKLNFYEAHLADIFKNGYTGPAKAATCKKCHIAYMQKLEREKRTTRSKIADKKRESKAKIKKNKENHRDFQYFEKMRKRVSYEKIKKERKENATA
jgi:hypothetical protein